MPRRPSPVNVVIDFALDDESKERCIESVDDSIEQRITKDKSLLGVLTMLCTKFTRSGE